MTSLKRKLSEDVGPYPLPGDRRAFRYAWPYPGALDSSAWQTTADGQFRIRALKEDSLDLQRDSRWPAFFPSPMCIATVGDGSVGHVEKVVGSSIVNRFPYVVALSFCRQSLSDRHYARSSFMAALERTGSTAVQFIMPGPELQSLLGAIAMVPEDEPRKRFEQAGVATHHIELESGARLRSILSRLCLPPGETRQGFRWPRRV